jgi:hypothetical protein
MFRTLGLRHLIVVNQRNSVVGIVTRAEMTEAHMMKCFAGKPPRTLFESKETHNEPDSISMTPVRTPSLELFDFKSRRDISPEDDL